MPPKLNIDRNFKNIITMKANTSKVIEVPFCASPMPKVSWSFNGGKFTDEKRITVETIRGMTALTISRAVRKDAGQYQLKIENNLGTVTLDVQVIVLGEFDNCIHHDEFQE